MILKAFDDQLKQSEDRQSSPSTPSIWRGAILPYLSTRLSLVLIGLLTDFYILPLLKSSPVLPSPPANTHFPDVFWLMWQRFDSGFYNQKWAGDALSKILCSYSPRL